MNKKYLILIVIAIIITIILLLLIFNKKEEKVEISKIKSFHFSYSNGYSINANTRYELNYDKNNNQYIAVIKPYEVSEEDKQEIIVDDLFVEEILKVLKEYRIDKWNGFNKTNQNVLDGDGFNLSINMDNNQRIQASGYMMWPDNYKEFQSRISNIFMNKYQKKNKELF